jgi:Mg2+-importing ATPase
MTSVPRSCLSSDRTDVGISVDTAVDIAKASADLILLHKDLQVLERGILEGRRVFGNIVKYVKMAASSNFGNALSVLLASAFLPFLPMLSLQLLVQNLLYDLSQMALPWDHLDGEFLARPRQWEARSIARFIPWLGPISSLFDLTTFGLL